MAPGPADAELSRKLIWLSVFRTVSATVLLGATVFLSFFSEGGLPPLVSKLLFLLVAAIYLLTLVYLLLLRRAGRQGMQAWAQVLGDVLMAGAVVYLTGGTSSIFEFMFILAVVNGAILLFAKGAFWAAVASALVFTAISFGQQLALFPAAVPQVQGGALPTGSFLSLLFTNISAYFLVAALASYLAGQLRATGEKLKAKTLDLKALHRLHDGVLRSIPTGILTTDRAELVSYLNPAAEQILARPLLDAVGRSATEIFPALAGRLRSPVPGRAEAELQLPSGERRRLGFGLSNLYDRDGREDGVVVVLQDLSKIRALEDSLHRAEKLGALGRMAAGLAHELRNPIASMGGAVEMLRKLPSLSADDQRLMDIVLREIERVNRLVSDFLVFARPTPAALAAVDLKSMLQETLDVFVHSPEARVLQLKTELKEARVLGDPGQIRQVLWNLLMNAAQAMPNGGELGISTLESDGFVTVEVQDQGAGIQPDDLARIFEPFFTTKEDGTGLGLSLVHSIIEAHGGKVTVRSKPGEGAIFAISLPLAGEHPRVESSPGRAQAAGAS